MNGSISMSHPLHLPEETFIFIAKAKEMRLDVSKESVNWIEKK